MVADERVGRDRNVFRRHDRHIGRDRDRSFLRGRSIIDKVDSRVEHGNAPFGPDVALFRAVAVTQPFGELDLIGKARVDGFQRGHLEVGLDLFGEQFFRAGTDEGLRGPRVGIVRRRERD